MARSYSDSESEEERHDRFKSERNPSSLPVVRNKLPTTLDEYTSKCRTPLRLSDKDSRYRDRFNDRRYSPPRRRRSPERVRDKISPRDSKARRSSSIENKHRRRHHGDDRRESRHRDDKHNDHKHSNHKHKRSDDVKHKKRDSLERDGVDRRIKKRSLSISEDELSDTIKKKTAPSDVSTIESKEVVTLPRYYELINDSSSDSGHVTNSDEKKAKKRRFRDKSEDREDKKRKKDKSHKKKHEKRKSKGDCDNRIAERGFSDSIDKINDVVVSSDEKEFELIKSGSSGSLPNSPGLPMESVEMRVQKDSIEQEEGEISGNDESEQFFGPALPPAKKKVDKVYGPSKPSDEDLYGPVLPPSHPAPEAPPEADDDSELPSDVIGPLPTGHASAAQSALDQRATLLKYQMDNKRVEDDNKKREAWMMELPEVRGAQIGLGPRKFRANAAPDMSDRSSWTDTPEDKARKKLLGDEKDHCDIDTRKLEIYEKNKEMEEMSKKSSKKSKSLLEMHQKKLKKKKKKEAKERGDKPEERRPFSRELDLQTNRFDDAQKKSIIKKAQLLNTRFSAGESKYL